MAERLIGALDVALKTLTGSYRHASRANPGHELTDSVNDAERAELIGLMRVNHTGEVCAQALYAGQALFARDPETRMQMQHSAQEEIDHLVWCDEQLQSLGGHRSRLNPVFYAASFALGAGAALVSDKTSLGFVHATEENVEAHLDEHLDRLPQRAQSSRAVLEQMKQDEVDHGQAALTQGGEVLPKPIRAAMKTVAKAMTATAFRV